MGQRRKCPRQSLFDFADDRCFIMSLFGRYRRVTGSNRPLFVTLMEQLGESFSQSSSVPSSSTSVPSSDKNIILNKHFTLNRHVILNKYVIFKKQGTTFKTFLTTKGSFRILFCGFFPLGVSPPPPPPQPHICGKDMVPKNCGIVGTESRKNTCFLWIFYSAELGGTNGKLKLELYKPFLGMFEVSKWSRNFDCVTQIAIFMVRN